MLKILRRERKTTATMANRSSPSESFDEYDIVVDDLSAWEFINPSSSEDDEDQLDDFSFTDEDTNDEGFSGPKEEGPLEFGFPLELGFPSSDISMESLTAQLHNYPDVVVRNDAAANDEEDENGNNDDNGDDDCDDGYGLDDELVPWNLSDKFGRQRIRKIGKRACPRMIKSKRLACRYNRPGIVHGKHGFGVQHCCI